MIYGATKMTKIPSTTAHCIVLQYSKQLYCHLLNWSVYKVHMSSHSFIIVFLRSILCNWSIMCRCYIHMHYLHCRFIPRSGNMRPMSIVSGKGNVSINTKRHVFSENASLRSLREHLLLSFVCSCAFYISGYLKNKFH